MQKLEQYYNAETGQVWMPGVELFVDLRQMAATLGVREPFALRLLEAGYSLLRAGPEITTPMLLLNEYEDHSGETVTSISFKDDAYFPPEMAIEERAEMLVSLRKLILSMCESAFRKGVEIGTVKGRQAGVEFMQTGLRAFLGAPSHDDISRLSEMVERVNDKVTEF